MHKTRSTDYDPDSPISIADRAAAKEKLKVAKAELDARTRRLESEKKELQSALEKYQSEE